MSFFDRFALCSLCLALAMPAQAGEPVKLTGHPNWPPFSWQRGDRIVGIGPDFAEIVFRDVGLSVISVPSGNWKRAQAQVAAGAVDVLVAAYRTAERTRSMAYPAAPFMQDVNVLWVLQERQFPFHQWEDLIGKHGSAMLGESYGQKFDDFIKEKLQIEWVSTPAQSLQKLALGRADYYPFSLHGGQIQIKQYGYQGMITHLPMAISTEDIYITMSKRSRYLKYLPALEAAIAARRADGTVERLIHKYTPPE
ncbi:MAG: transporter substrate-binding domain-containing protein [Pseudomonadota bacterium]